MTISILVLSTLAIAFLIFSGAVVIDQILERKLLKGGPEPAPADDRLRPVEFGYLVRNGDRNHASLVLVVDLLQRAAKEQQEGPALKLPELAVYEKQMWTNVRESVRSWAHKKIEDVHPGDIRKNPVRFIERVAWIYNFVTGTLKTMVKDIVADPRQLKRYFTIGGVLRLLADFSTTGYQSMFEKELKKDLLARGLIVSEERRLRFARVYLSIALLGMAACFTGIYFLVAPLKLAITVGAFSLVLAFLVRLIYEGKSFLPYYSEVMHLLSTLSRTGKRVTLVRFLLRLVNGLFLFIIIELTIILLIAAYLFFLWMAKDQIIDLLIVTAIFAIVEVKILNLAFKAWRLAVEERATARGMKLQSELQKKVSGVSPIETLKHLLSEKDYDPTFSELIAIYGPEALIILS